MYVVAVLIQTSDPAALRPAILANAADSLAEPGCHTFDVCFSDDGSKCFLYEIYDDEAAFRAHLATEHFRAFDAACADIVTSKRVETFWRAQR